MMTIAVTYLLATLVNPFLLLAVHQSKLPLLLLSILQHLDGLSMQTAVIVDHIIDCR
jgi:hypothetical protein